MHCLHMAMLCIYCFLFLLFLSIPYGFSLSLRNLLTQLLLITNSIWVLILMKYVFQIINFLMRH